MSPLLANVYLHYVFDLWAHQWRRCLAHGDVVIVRWADDFVVGFEHERDAQEFLADLRERFEKFGLELADDKTRLIEFGRFAAQRRTLSGWLPRRKRAAVAASLAVVMPRAGRAARRVLRSRVDWSWSGMLNVDAGEGVKLGA